MTNDQIWEMLKKRQAPDPLTGAEAIVINDIKAKMRLTIASEGLSPELCAAMGFHHIAPGDLGRYVFTHLNQNPKLKIGILRQSAEVVPILTRKQS
jgi:hypothetical protein